MDDVSSSPEYRRLRHLLAEQEEALIKMLGEKERQAFLLCCDTESAVCALSGREDFARGFRLGAQLLLEMLSPYQNT